MKIMHRMFESTNKASCKCGNDSLHFHHPHSLIPQAFPLYIERSIIEDPNKNVSPAEVIVQELSSPETSGDTFISERMSPSMNVKDVEFVTEQKIQRRHSNFHPIQGIPFELLENIFSHYLDDEPRSLGKLQLVCRTWRAVVDESPSLWTRIALIGPFRDDTAPCKRYINKCVEKSATLPIYVTFEPRCSSAWSLLAGGEILTHLSMAASRRWHSFYLSGVGDKVNWYLLIDVIGALPHILKHATNLRVLVIDNPWTGHESHGISTSLTLEGEDTLRVLKLYGVSWNFDGAMKPFHHVEDLTIGWNTSWGWLSLIHQCPCWLRLFPSVRVLTLMTDRMQVFHPEPRNDHMVYEASTLTRLILHGPVSLIVLASFTFPALRDLVIESNEASAHCLNIREGWNVLDVGSVENLIFVGGRDGFVLIGSTNDWRARIADQDYMRSLFARFPNIKYLKAPTCVWREIRDTFEVYIRGLEDAANGLVADSHIIDSDTLFTIFGTIGDCSYMP